MSASEQSDSDQAPPPTTRRPRLLLMAYYCQPNRGSEYGAGWNRALECAKDFDTWVISRNGPTAEHIKEYIATQGPIAGLNFAFVTMSRWQEWLLDLAWIKWFLVRWWHRKALQLARQLHSQHQFDLIQHVTCISFREPGELWKLDVPFIWGPIGGADSVPWNFLHEGGIASAFSEGLRSLISYAQMHWSPRIAKVAKRADYILFANSLVRSQVERAHRVTGPVLQDTGLRSVRETPREARSRSGPFRILWSGALEPRKGLSLLLKALVLLLPDGEFTLRVLGEGTMEHRWKRQAIALGVADSVEWMGWLPFQEAQRQYDWADVFVFSSLRDTGGNVNLEAMANGLPIICLDHQGVHDMVTKSCGIKIPVTNSNRVVRDLHDAVLLLSRNDTLRASMSAASLDRARDFLWSRNQEFIREIYHEVMSTGRGMAQSAGGEVASVARRESPQYARLHYFDENVSASAVAGPTHLDQQSIAEGVVDTLACNNGLPHEVFARR